MRRGTRWSVAHKAAVTGAGSLAFAGLALGATAAPHLMRFGRGFAVPALASFGIAGIAVRRNLSPPRE